MLNLYCYMSHNFKNKLQYDFSTCRFYFVREIITYTAATFPAELKSCRSAEGHGLSHLWSHDYKTQRLGLQFNHNNNNPSQGLVKRSLLLFA